LHSTYIATSLTKVGIAAKVKRNKVLLNTESLVGLVIYAGAAPPGFTRLYASPSLHVFAEEDGAHLYFYLAVKHEGVWRAVRRKYAASRASFSAKDRNLAEAIWHALDGALRELGESPNALPPMQRLPNRWYTVTLNAPQLSRFLQHAAEGVEVGPATVALDGNALKIAAGGAEAAFDFEPTKGRMSKYIKLDLPSTLKLYKALRALGIPVWLAPEGIGIDLRAVWSLLAAAAGSLEPGSEVVQGVVLVGRYNVDGRELYAFSYVYDGKLALRFVLKDDATWKSTGGYLNKSTVYATGDVVEVANAINSIYLKRGVSRRIAADGKKVLELRMKDLELLGLKRLVVRQLVELARQLVASEIYTSFSNPGLQTS